MHAPPPPTIWNGHALAWGSRTYVMGILNITPDSFSRDGLALEGMSREEVVRAAVAKARCMVEDGADLLDVGGESTRPGTVGLPPLDEAVERARVVPVIEALAAELPPHLLISIDTYKASVARAALDAGAAPRQRRLWLALRSRHSVPRRRAGRAGRPDEQSARPAAPGAGRRRAAPALQ